MSITNIPKNTLENLFQPLIIKELNEKNVIDKIKSDAATYSKLKLLLEQAELLKNQIKNVINEGILNFNLHEVECLFQKVSGNTYFLYKKKNNKYFFSILSPNDWNNNPPHEFINSYLYDYDKSFKLV